MNIDTQLQTLYRKWQKEPSQEMLTLLYKRSKRAGKRLMCNWYPCPPTESFASRISPRELIDVTELIPLHFVCYTGITIPMGTVHFYQFSWGGSAVPATGGWYIFDEYRGTLRVSIE